MAVNKFIGMGYVGREPDIREMKDGKVVANLSLGMTEKYKDKNGVQKELTEWVQVVFFGRVAEIVAQYVSKGDQLFIEGKLKTESFEKDGQKRSATKVIASSMQMIKNKTKEHNTRHEEQHEQQHQQHAQALDDFDDALPF